MSRDRFREGELSQFIQGWNPAAAPIGFGNEELEAIQQERELEARNRRAQARALRRMAEEDRVSPLFNEEGSPMVQPERGLQRQLGVRSQDDIALEEFATSPGVSAALGMGEVLPLHRVGAGIANELSGGSYGGAQQEINRMEAANPLATGAGVVAGSLPMLAAGPLLGDAAIARLGGTAALPGYAQAIPAMSRVGAAGLEGMLLGGVNEAARTGSVGPEAMFSGAMGAGIAGAAAGLGAATQYGRSLVDGLEDTAKQWRTRAAGGRTVGVQRGLADLPGGIEGVADDLDSLGISPRYSVHSVDDAREVAARVRDRAGRNINNVFERMAQADADDAARFASESGHVQARDAERAAAFSAIDADDPSDLLLTARPGSPSHSIGREIFQNRVSRHEEPFMRAAREALDPAHAPTISSDAAPDLSELASVAASPRANRRPPRPSSARTPENLMRALDRGQITDVFAGGAPEFRNMQHPQALDPRSEAATGRLRQMVDVMMPGIEAPAPAGVVDVGPVANDLDAVAGGYRGLPSGAGPEAAASSMAQDYRATGGRMPFSAAQRERQLLDEAIRWQPGTNPLNDRRGAIQGDLRRIRGALQGQMDDAVRRVDPELGAEYPRQRREYQIGKIFTNLGDDDALRETANRLVSPTDYYAGGQGDGWLAAARNALLNRVLRGREASLGATMAERTSDLLQRTPDLSRPMNAIAGRAGRVAGAADVPERQQPAPRPMRSAPAASEPFDANSLPVLDVPEDVEEVDLNDLPVLEVSDDIEEVTF